MAQIELSVLGELKTSTMQHKLKWQRPSETNHRDWTADVGSYEFTVLRENPNAPHLRIVHSDDEVAVIDGPEVTSLLRSIEEESKAMATEEKNAKLAQVLVTLETHREADRGSFFARTRYS